MKKGLFAFVFTSFVLQLAAQAAPVCRDVFYLNEEVQKLVHYDPVKQWLLWEQKSNIEKFRKPETPISVGVLYVPLKELNATFTNDVPKNLYRSLVTPKGALWFKHPFNQKDSIPYFNSPEKGSIQAYQTASRSLAVILGVNVFTLKLATDHPHGPKGEFQPAKATTKEDLADGINRMSYLGQVDRKIGKDSELILAKEVAMVSEKNTGEGYLFRDLSFLNDGNYYLPALSIPFAGREIAKANGSTVEVFWQEHYAALLGKAKAKLLLRYGLQMETPNAQNMLIQLDRDLKPTGVMVFRDISDTILIEPIAKAMGESATLQKDAQRGVENGKQLRPFWKNSSWRFDEAGDLSISATTLTEWGRAHDQAYKAEIEKELGVDLSQFANLDRNPEFDSFMSSEVVLKKVEEYRKKLQAQETERKAAQSQAS